MSNRKLVQQSTSLKPHVNRLLEDHHKATKLSKSLIIAEAVEFCLDPKFREEREAGITDRIDRLEAAFKKHRELTVRNQTIMMETLFQFAKVYLTNTPEVPEEHRKAAVSAGNARFEKFMDRVEQALTGGKSVSSSLTALADMDDELEE